MEYTDASDDACRVQSSQEYDGQELPVTFHTPSQKLNENGAPQAGQLWGILHHNQVELLPPRFRYCGKKQSHTFAEVP